MNINSLLSHLVSNIAQVYFELFNMLSKLKNPNIRRTRGAQNLIATCKRRLIWQPTPNNDEGFAKAIERFIPHRAGSALPGAMVDPDRARHSCL
jgi:hypothetical protein